MELQRTPAFVGFRQCAQSRRGWLNWVTIGSTGALKWISPRSKDMLAPGTVGLLRAEKRLEPAPEEPMESLFKGAVAF